MCSLCAVQAAPVVLLVLRTPRRITFTPCIIRLYSRKAFRDRHDRGDRAASTARGSSGGRTGTRGAGGWGGVRDVCQLVWQSGTSDSLPNGDEMEASYSLDTLHSCRRGSTQGRRQLHLCELGRRGPSGADGGRERHAMPASSIESERRHARKPNGATRIDARAHAPRLRQSPFFTVGCTFVYNLVRDLGSFRPPHPPDVACRRREESASVRPGFSCAPTASSTRCRLA